MNSKILSGLRLKAFAISIICLGFFGCGETNNEISSDTKITNGRATQPGDPGYGSVVGVVISLGRGGDGSVSYEICSGTLIARNLVVTAAHCLADVGSTDQIILVFGTDTDEAHEQYINRNIKNPVVAIGFNKEHRDSYHDDIGWVKFSGSIPSHYKPMPIFTNINSVTPGTTISVAGFGDYSDTEIGGENRTTTTRFKKYYGSGWGEGYFSTEGTNGNVCDGDSGGPAYVQSGGRWYLLGATTGPNWVEYGTNPNPACEKKTGLFTYIGKHLSWLQSDSGVRLNGAGGNPGGGINPGGGSFNVSWDFSTNRGLTFVSPSGRAPAGTVLLKVTAPGNQHLAENTPNGTSFRFTPFYYSSSMGSLTITAYDRNGRVLGSDTTIL